MNASERLRNLEQFLEDPAGYFSGYDLAHPARHLSFNMRSKGHSIEAIAGILFISEVTVREHIKEFRASHGLGENKLLERFMIETVRKLVGE